MGCAILLCGYKAASSTPVARFNKKNPGFFTLQLHSKKTRKMYSFTCYTGKSQSTNYFMQRV